MATTSKGIALIGHTVRRKIFKGVAYIPIVKIIAHTLSNNYDIGLLHDFNGMNVTSAVVNFLCLIHPRKKQLKHVEVLVGKLLKIDEEITSSKIRIFQCAKYCVGLLKGVVYAGTYEH